VKNGSATEFRKYILRIECTRQITSISASLRNSPGVGLQVVDDAPIRVRRPSLLDKKDTFIFLTSTSADPSHGPLLIKACATRSMARQRAQLANGQAIA
jgi:hypothetical protein